MQVQAVGRPAIEYITQDRTVQSFLVCTVHTQLVGATGMWSQDHDRMSIAIHSQEFITGLCLLAPLFIHHLTRAIHNVGPQWQPDDTLTGYLATDIPL